MWYPKRPFMHVVFSARVRSCPGPSNSSPLRLLVFHPGGLTASLSYDITELDGLKSKQVARRFLTC